jgi:endoglucanase
MALNSETGGGNVASCQKMLCAQIAFIKYSLPSKFARTLMLTNCFSENSDVYLGYVGWSAGSFDSTYGKHSSKAVA